MEFDIQNGDCYTADAFGTHTLSHLNPNNPNPNPNCKPYSNF